MVSPILNEYEPDTVPLPGDTLRETLDALSMTQTELAKRMGRPEKLVSEIIHGKTQITLQTALDLERVLNVPARFWSNLERNYRDFLMRLDQKKQLNSWASWLTKLPVSDMIRRGWIRRFSDRGQQLGEVLAFFGAASPESCERLWRDMQVSLRKSASFESSSFSLAAWLRRGEVLASEIACAPYDREAFRKTLHGIRNLTLTYEGFDEELRKACARCGVAVVFVPQLPKCPLSGATRWIGSGKALIQLSLRYKKNDILWFSFFHEAGHILLHRKRSIFLDAVQMVGDTQEEKEADRFAADLLIPPQDYKTFVGARNFGKRAIEKFARKVGIASGIVVGRLQHDGHIDQAYHNDLKVKLAWT